MTKIQIVNPRWRPSYVDVDQLNQAVAAAITGKGDPPFSGHGRRKLSKSLALDAVMALLTPCIGHFPVIDADTIRVNMPGYDVLVGDHLKIQVKGGTFVDSIGWTHTPNNPNAADLGFDLEIAVDIGVVLNPRPEGPKPDGRASIPVLPYVDFYIIPGDVVRAQVAKGERINKMGAQLYLYKRDLSPNLKECRCQWHDLAIWRNRFDVLEQALGQPLLRGTGNHE